MQRLIVALLALMLLASPVMAQGDIPEDVEVEPAEVTPPNEESLLEELLEQIGDVAQAIGSAAEGASESVQKTAGALGQFFGQLVAGLVTGSAALASGMGAIGSALASGIGTAFAAVGEGVTAAIAFLATGIGLAAAFLAKAYGSLIGSLRPDGMSQGAYLGMTAGMATVSTGAASWSGWQALRKWGVVGSGIAFPIAGFSRINDDELLDHPVRSKIFSTIQQHPGIHASQLAREVGVGWGTVSHHLDKLDRAKMVTTRKVNNQKCFFEQGGTISRQDMEAASAIKGDTAGAIAGFVHANPMTSQKDMAEALGISAALASFHVKKLTNLGVLDKMRHGKETLLTTSGSMRRLLEADADLQKAMDQRADEALQYGA